jgi:hypothetical protein
VPDHQITSLFLCPLWPQKPLKERTMEMQEEGQLEFQEGTEIPSAEEETAAEMEGEEEEGAETAPETGEDAAAAPEPRKGGKVQERIDELTGKWRSTERDRDDWRDAYFKLQQQTEVKKEPEAPPMPIEPDMSDLPKPKWESFETEEDYRAAEIEWQAERVFRKKELQRQQVAIREQQKQEKVKFEGWLGEAEQKYPDFRQTAMKPFEQGGPAITLEMDSAIRTDPLGHDIAYYLGKNPEESKKIAALPPIVQIREIGRLSAKLETKEVKPRTETRAPAPTRGTTSGVETPTKDPLKMSFKEYEAMRNKQLYGGG